MNVPQRKPEEICEVGWIWWQNGTVERKDTETMSASVHCRPQIFNGMFGYRTWVGLVC
jgi:hypothetical protein